MTTIYYSGLRPSALASRPTALIFLVSRYDQKKWFFFYFPSVFLRNSSPCGAFRFLDQRPKTLDSWKVPQVPNGFGKSHHYCYSRYSTWMGRFWFRKVVHAASCSGHQHTKCDHIYGYTPYWDQFSLVSSMVLHSFWLQKGDKPARDMKILAVIDDFIEREKSGWHIVSRVALRAFIITTMKVLGLCNFVHFIIKVQLHLQSANA